MDREPPSNRFVVGLWLRQSLVLALVSFLFVIPRLYSAGTNIVTETYRLGALRFFNGTNPYALPLIGGDRYEYSPFFCLVYGPFTLLPLKLQALGWAFLNSFVFWLGVCAWVRLRTKSSRWLFLAFIACSMELNICLLYQQVNALLIGIVLIGLANFRDRRYLSAGMLLALATNLKTLPGIFAVSLLFPLRSRYLFGLTLASLVVLLAPAMFVGFLEDIHLHMSWFGRLIDAYGMVTPLQLDAASTFHRFGMKGLGLFIQSLVLILSLIALFMTSAKKITNWPAWIVVGASAVLLVSPRTESPTFVLVAPAYVLLMAYLQTSRASSRVRAAGISVLCAAIFFITLSFTDVWPKVWWNPGSLKYATKCWGTLVLWAMAIGLLSCDLFRVNSPFRLPRTVSETA